ncbi:MFS transporter [Streptomyces sp. NPDC004134]|uniref:MFS transporter n=1 Tax=Streptomyces sp. NPDC004134 TaxID=3364691 RepID=UPI0036A0757C
MTAPAAPAASPSHSSGPAARSVGLRLGALFGPAVFGVTAAGVALPDVARGLDASPAAATWVLTAHALALGIGTALAGRLADALGVRRILGAGAAVLAVGAVVCLLAPSLEVLVAGRFLLAAGSGAMTSGALALMAATAPERRAHVLAVFGAVMAVCSAAATLAGGVVTEWAGWRPTLVLPALSLLALPFCLRLVPLRGGGGRAPDLPGAVLLTLTAAGLLLLVQSTTLDLPPAAVAGTAAVLLVAGTGCAVRTVRRPGGFVPYDLVRDPLFRRAAATGAGVYAGLFGAMYAVPQLLVRDHGWSVFAVGGWLLPGAVAGAALSRVASGPGPRGARLPAAVAAAAAVLLGAAALTEAPAVLVVGTSAALAAFAVTQVVLTGLLSAHLAPERRGGALSLLNLAFFVGGGAGSAVAGTLADSAGLAAALGVVAAFPLAAAAAAVRLRGPDGG